MDTFELKEIEHLKNFLDYLRNLSDDGISEENIHFVLNHLNSIPFFSNLILTGEFPVITRLTINRKVLNENKRINNISHLKYPPSDKVSQYGRCNYPKQSVLYASFLSMTAINELKPQIGDLVTISEWKTQKDESLIYCPIFKNQPTNGSINPRLFNYTGHFQQAISHYTESEKHMINLLIQFITDCFTKKLDSKNSLNYIFSSYFSNKIFNELENGTVEAIYYPSVQERLSFENLAIKPDAFDRKYILDSVKESVVISTPSVYSNGYMFEGIADCKVFDYSTGQILWEKSTLHQPPERLELLKRNLKFEL